MDKIVMFSLLKFALEARTMFFTHPLMLIAVWKYERACNFFAIRLRMLISFLDNADKQLIL